MFDPPETPHDVRMQTLARVLVLQSVVAELVAAASADIRGSIAGKLRSLMAPETDGSLPVEGEPIRAAAREAMSVMFGANIPPGA